MNETGIYRRPPRERDFTLSLLLLVSKYDITSSNFTFIGDFVLQSRKIATTKIIKTIFITHSFNNPLLLFNFNFSLFENLIIHSFIVLYLAWHPRLVHKLTNN